MSPIFTLTFLRSGLTQQQRSSRNDRAVITLPNMAVECFLAFTSYSEDTLATIFDAAWAQTFSIHIQSSDAAFGYIVSERDYDDIPNALEIAGPLINILAYHMHFVSIEDSPDALLKLARQIQEQRLNDSAHIFCRLQGVLDSRLVIGELFNTAVNFKGDLSQVWKAA